MRTSQIDRAVSPFTNHNKIKSLLILLNRGLKRGPQEIKGVVPLVDAYIILHIHLPGGTHKGPT